MAPLGQRRCQTRFHVADGQSLDRFVEITIEEHSQVEQAFQRQACINT